MKAIVLAAGYATRLYPHTLKCAKPLLEVGGKPIVEHIIRKIEEVKDVDGIYVVTNAKFYPQFDSWHKSFDSSIPVEVINDNTTSNEDRLGALGDIKLVMDQCKIKDDVMIIAGDNLFDLSLNDMNEFYQEKHSTLVAVYDVGDIKLCTQYGIVALDDEHKITSFQEKPAEPLSTLASTGIHFFPKSAVDKLGDYLQNGTSDTPGNFLEWLHTIEPVYGFITKEAWYDIGSVEQLEKARKDYLNR